MYNFNEQGKFESHDVAKEHSEKIEDGFYYHGKRKSTKDIAIGIFTVVALIAGIILLAYFFKG